MTFGSAHKESTLSAQLLAASLQVSCPITEVHEIITQIIFDGYDFVYVNTLDASTAGR